jgi:ABC-type sugar transport system ATPase subunit
MNLLPGSIGRSPHDNGADDVVTVEVSSGSVPLPPPLRAAAAGAGLVVLGLRPESLRIDPEGPLRADVTIVELLGAETHVICTTPDGSRLIVRQPPQAAKPASGDQVHIAIDPDPAALHLFDAATTQRLVGP